MHAAAFQPDTNVRGVIGAREQLGVVEKSCAGIELAAQTLYTRKLGQDFRSPRTRGLQLELRDEAIVGRVEIVEVPQRPQAVCHAAHCRTSAVQREQ